MNKQKEHMHSMRKKKQQKNQARWWAVLGIALLLVASLWIVFSNRQPENVSARPISRLTTADFHSLAFSPTEPESIFFGHHDGLLVSHNGGKDWQPTTLSNTDAMALAAPPSNPQIMYAAGHEVFYKSTDSGETWVSVTTDLPGLDIHGLTADPENADRVYAHVVGFGIFSSEDGGSKWTKLSDTAPPSAFNLAVGENSESLYVAAGQAGLWQSLNGGRTWTKVNGSPDEGAITVAYVRANGRLFVTTLGNSAGLYVSNDDAQSWQSTSLRETLLAIAVSPLDPNHVVVVNDKGEIFASRDGGITWLDK
jgi:photosystem II stability/assembly factor-like uncharacterized protein